MLPNLTRTTKRERAERKRKVVELSWEEQYTPELQPPLWSLRHPFSELRHHARDLQLLRSFSLPFYYTNTSTWYVPVLRNAKVRNAVVWQLRSEVCGSINLLHLISNTNVSITVHLTTAVAPASPSTPIYTLPAAADEWSAQNEIVYSPHSHTSMLPVSHHLVERPTASRHFRWRLPALVPFTLYLPIATATGPSWVLRQCHNGTSPTGAAQSAGVMLLHQHQGHDRCPVGEDTTLWPREPAMRWDVWHLLGLQAGQQRLELILPVSTRRLLSAEERETCEALRPADLMLEIEFVDRAADPSLLPAPT